MKSIQNECAVITGGATGIGRATAILLAQHGAKVIVSDFNDEKGKETVARRIKNSSQWYWEYQKWNYEYSKVITKIKH